MYKYVHKTKGMYTYIIRLKIHIFDKFKNIIKYFFGNRSSDKKNATLFFFFGVWVITFCLIEVNNYCLLSPN